MRRTLGFTLIEVMIAVVIIAILTAIAYPSYQDYVRRGIRSQGQQFLLDLAQRQEQYFIDNRAYATLVGTGAGGLGLTFAAPCTVPCEFQGKYSAAIITTTAGPPPTFKIAMSPIGMMAGDGTLFVNSTQVRWRSISATSATYDSTKDCR